MFAYVFSDFLGSWSCSTYRECWNQWSYCLGIYATEFVLESKPDEFELWLPEGGILSGNWAAAVIGLCLV